MDNNLVSAVVGLGGAVIGGLLVMLGQYLQDARVSKERKRSLAHAIAAEIEAYISLMDRRGHEGYAEDIIETNKKGEKKIPKDWISGFERELEVFPVMRSALPEIGLLGTLAGDVAKFYTQTSAIYPLSAVRNRRSQWRMMQKPTERRSST